jgi:hypothetical protein
MAGNAVVDKEEHASGEAADVSGSSASGAPTASEYGRWGVSARGLRQAALEFGKIVGLDATTSDICHAAIKLRTTPVGWECEPRLTDEKKRWYNHEYVQLRTGHRQEKSPPGTCSFCEFLDADMATASLVGPPTVFLSHAWLYKFTDVVGAVEGFSKERMEAGDPEPFYWFDCFSIDQHASQNFPRDWWGSTFKETIQAIGHTVMILSPWASPFPLTRAWCLWELFCTVEGGKQFDVCLPSAERHKCEAGRWCRPVRDSLLRFYQANQ